MTVETLGEAWQHGWRLHVGHHFPFNINYLIKVGDEVGNSRYSAAFAMRFMAASARAFCRTPRV